MSRHFLPSPGRPLLFTVGHLSLQPELPFTLPTHTYGPLQLLYVCYRNRPTRHTLTFFAILGFAISFSGAFQIPFLLNHLHFTYFQLAASTSLFVFARFIAAPWVGKIVDTHGSRKPLMIASALLPIVAFGWAVSGSFYGILMTQFIAGIIWTGFEVFSFTFLAENTQPAERHRIFATKQVAWNFSSAAGALGGAAFATYFTSAAAVFWASCILRIFAVLFLLGLPIEQFATDRESKEEIASPEAA